jgi:hypothetical protein
MKEQNYERFCRELWPLEIDKRKESYEPVTVDPDMWKEIRKQMNRKTDKEEFKRIVEKHDKIKQKKDA